MASSRVKDERHGLDVDVKDPGAGTKAVAFSQRFQDAIDCFFSRVKAGKDTGMARAKFSSTCQTTIESSVIRTIETNQQENRFRRLCIRWDKIKSGLISSRCLN